MNNHFLGPLSDRASQPFNLQEAFQCICIYREQIKTCSAQRKTNTPGIVGLDEQIEQLLVAIISGGHCLYEAEPGLAKTFLVKTAANASGLTFDRIQGMPDILPSDIIMKERFVERDGKTRIANHFGPVFCNLLLVDEINRTPPKTQAALLEAAEEGSVTVLNYGRLIVRPVHEYDLLSRYGPFFGLPKCNPRTRMCQVFTMLATQNPVEQDGTFPLSAAKEDRFMFKVLLDYPRLELFKQIAQHAFYWASPQWDSKEVAHVQTLYFFDKLRRKLFGPHAWAHWDSDENVALREMVEQLINFSHYRPVRSSGYAKSDVNRFSRKQNELQWILKKWEQQPEHKHRVATLHRLVKSSDYEFPEIMSGASPRGLIKMIRAAHAYAFLQGKIEGDRVRPTFDCFKAIAPAILRHRLTLSAGSHAMGAHSDSVVDLLLNWIEQW